MVSGSVRWAQPSWTGSGPHLALRFSRSRACVLATAQREPQPTAAPEQAAAPRTSVARPLTRLPVQVESSPTTPSSSRHIPSLSQPALCHSRQTAGSAPSPRHHAPGAPGHPSRVLLCPGVHQCGPPSGSADPPYPTPTPTPTPTHHRSVPASHACLARRRPRPHASAEALLAWPSDLSARSPRAPRLPFPPALHADAPPKHPRPASQLPARRRPLSLPSLCPVPDPRGAPTSHGPKHLRPAPSPTDAHAHGPGRGGEETSCGDAEHTSGHRGSFPTGDSASSHRTRDCRPRRTLVPFVGRPLTPPAPKDTVLEQT